MFKIINQLTEFISNHLQGTNFDYMVNYYEYKKWLNPKTTEELKYIAKNTSKDLFDFFKEEVNK